MRAVGNAWKGSVDGPPAALESLFRSHPQAML